MLRLEIKIFFRKLLDLEKKLVTFPHFLIPAYISVKMISESWMCPSEGGDKAFIYISRDHMINESCDSVGEIPST